MCYLTVLERSFSSKIFFSNCSTALEELGFSNIYVSSFFAIESLLTKIYSAFAAVSILVSSTLQKLHPGTTQDIKIPLPIWTAVSAL